MTAFTPVGYTVDLDVKPLILFVSCRMWGHTQCPPQCFQHGVFFPRIVNSHPSGLPMERPRAVPRKEEIAFPQDISPDLFKDMAVERIVLCHGVLGDNWKLSVFVYLHFPALFGHKAPPHTPWSNSRPLLPRLFVFLNRYLLLVVDFVLQTVLRREISSVCIYKSVFERVSSYLLGSPEGRKWLAGRKNYC